MASGVPQLLEYILRWELSDILRQFSILMSRLLCSWTLAKKSKTYMLYLGYDLLANKAFIADFVKGNRSGGKKA